MLNPIQKEHELVCPGCGAVLAEVTESNNENAKPITTSSIYVSLLGSVLEKNTKYAHAKSAQHFREEQVIKQLENITKHYDLPYRFVIETFKEMKKKNRGFWSESEPVKQLIKILSRDENYIHIKKLQKLKARYEKLSSI